jgi:hypothetical protein
MKAAAAARPGARSPVRPVIIGTERRHPVARAIELLFLGMVASAIYLVKFGVAEVPARALLSALILLIASGWRPQVVLTAIWTVRWILLTIASMALVGLLSSLVNGADVAVIIRQIFEIHVQAFIFTMVGAVVLALCGPIAIARAFVIVVGISAAIAILQYLRLEFAWQLRGFLASLQPAESGGDAIFFVLRLRPMGLSFSPVHLGTQLCLTFALVAAIRSVTDPQKFWSGLDIFVFCLFSVVAVAAVVSGNRSPLLGLAAFLVCYLFLTRPALAVLVAIILLPVALMLDDILASLADAGLRVARREDGSAEGRGVLRAYGLLLFFDRPLGYGLSFNSVEHWGTYWPRLSHYPNADAITIHALHNYYLMVMNKYGFAIMLLAGAVIYYLARHKMVLLVFIPYAIHIFYHNDGPFQSDFLFWLVLPLFLVLGPLGQDRRPRSAPALRPASNGRYAPRGSRVPIS